MGARALRLWCSSPSRHAPPEPVSAHSPFLSRRIHIPLLVPHLSTTARSFNSLPNHGQFGTSAPPSAMFAWPPSSRTSPGGHDASHKPPMWFPWLDCARTCWHTAARGFFIPLVAHLIDMVVSICEFGVGGVPPYLHIDGPERRGQGFGARGTFTICIRQGKVDGDTHRVWWSTSAGSSPHDTPRWGCRR